MHALRLALFSTLDPRLSMGSHQYDPLRTHINALNFSIGLVL